jgi:hypothetical protein
MRHEPAGWTPIAIVVAVVAAVAVVSASTVRITPVLADDKVMATFAAPSVFSADVREAVQSGLAVTFTFTAELRRTATLWFDHTVASADVSSTVKYDTLTGAYQVSKLRGDTVHWSQQTRKEDEMRLWMTEFERVTLDDLDALNGNGEYYIRVRARDNLPRGFSLWPFGRAEVSGRVELPPGR